MFSHSFHPSILRVYDIRGVYGETLSDSDAYALGIALSQLIKGKFVVGRDGRLSSQTLEENLIRGLVDRGCEVVKVGLCPTPMVYYAVKKMNSEAGIMITGSHNPPSFNGFKITLKDRPFYGEDIQALPAVLEKDNYLGPKGTCVTQDVSQDYLERILPKDLKPLKVIWDAGNGVAGPFIERLIQKLPGQHRVLFPQVEGSFPNRRPDPTQIENLGVLKQKVQEEKADLGIAFDGDGDRIAVIDNHLNHWLGDRLMILFSRDVLRHTPGARIVVDIKSSDLLVQDIEQHGGQAIRVPTGHSIIKTAMQEQHAILGGETSGHIFFKDDYYGYDDALYAALRLLSILSREVRTLGEIYDLFPVYHTTPEIRVVCPDKFFAMEKLAAWIKINHPKMPCEKMDGLRGTLPQGWWLIRASNTEESLVCRCESSSESGLADLKKFIDTALTQVGVPHKI